MQNEKLAEEKLSNQEEVNVAPEAATEEKNGEEKHTKSEDSTLTKLQEELSEQKDKYLRLYSDFENFRRRSSKEKLDFFKTASEEVITSLLPVLDDFERALAAYEKSKEETSLAEGIKLVYSKFYKTLEQKGLKPVDAKGTEFDVEKHEAITQIPSPDDSMKGKVIDEVEKGYYLNDKVIRFSKVVIGS